eukprot:GHUV01011615.1.p1 GENE.GHUV01011615.1~~GHUV01011615.1.p1  ORF type:complete len:281 (+),score=82.98 GHUV01011615.1:646-1488(+)
MCEQVARSSVTRTISPAAVHTAAVNQIGSSGDSFAALHNLISCHMLELPAAMPRQHSLWNEAILPQLSCIEHCHHLGHCSCLQAASRLTRLLSSILAIITPAFTFQSHLLHLLLLYMYTGSKLLYLGGASGTSVSHCSDLVGPEGAVYAVEFSHRSGRDLVNMAKQRPNVIPIIEDARHPQKYRMLVPMVDVVFADVAQPDQARIVGLNAQYFLKNGGNYVISIKASCIDSTAQPEAVFAREVKKLQEMQLKPREQVTLEPYERDHAMVVGVYRPPAKKA